MKAEDRQPILDRHRVGRPPGAKAVTYIDALEGELEALRVKLRQAVEALRVIANHNTNPRSAMDIARQALREIEGSAEG